MFLKKNCIDSFALPGILTEDVTGLRLASSVLGINGFCLSGSDRSPAPLPPGSGWRRGVKVCWGLDSQPLKHHGVAVLSAAVSYGLEAITGVGTEPPPRFMVEEQLREEFSQAGMAEQQNGCQPRCEH